MQSTAFQVQLPSKKATYGLLGYHPTSPHKLCSPSPYSNGKTNEFFDVNKKMDASSGVCRLMQTYCPAFIANHRQLRSDTFIILNPQDGDLG
jgi:hypothetical protein